MSGAMLMQGIALVQQGQLEAARPVLEAALAADGTSADGWNHLAATYRLRGEVAAAEAALRRALSCQPSHRGAAYNLAALLAERGDWVAAEPLLRMVLDLAPEHMDAARLRGRALFHLGRFAEAVEMCAPGDGWSLQLRGLCRRELGAAAEAVEDLRQAHAALGDDPEVLSNLGACLNSAGRPAEALEPLRRAAALAPHHATGHFNLGNTLLRLCQVDEAAEALARAVTLEPDHVDSHWNLGIAAMLRGDDQVGGRECEWRRRKSYAPRVVEAPEWTGGPLAGRSILLHAEQGLGDTIQFLRFVPQVAARGATVHLAVHQPLMRLVERFPGVASVCFLDGALPDTDLSLPMMSLPRILGIEGAPAGGRATDRHRLGRQSGPSQRRQPLHRLRRDLPAVRPAGDILRGQQGSSRPCRDRPVPQCLLAGR